ncbi:D-arabinono-1,4-lactone oxidase [Sandarakinorhabdus sp.]|uniref:D-arabinono-1,4-lactone oxidase n=1 Tax=Sandarakinorhabdus sp. TaxID=1916663 RepID=UPI003F7063D6
MGGAAATSMVTEWRNWSGSVVASPGQIASPRDEAELAAIIRAAAQVRVVGAGHSFMPLCETGGTLISMADYQGALEIAPDRRTVWAPAGWSLDRLGVALWAEGLSLINQGDIDPQSLAGATATGTHGTGADLGSIATQACGYRLMLADGTTTECGPGDELFEAQRLSLGLFGIATAIRIHVVPAYYLEERIERRHFDAVAERIDELGAATRHMEFFVFPYSNQVTFKTLHPVPAADFVPAKDDDSVFGLICELGAAAPSMIPTLQRTIMRMSGRATRRSGPAHRIFPSERSIRFEEMEYELPRANGIPILREAIAHIRKHRLPIAFPFEFRLTAADDIWLSPFNAGPAASLSFHQYAGMPWRAHFSAIEAIFRSGGGRPHWAKRHTLTTADVHRLYPRAADFLRVRKRVDPAGKFVNAHVAQLFDIQVAHPLAT